MVPIDWTGPPIARRDRGALARHTRSRSQNLSEGAAMAKGRGHCHSCSHCATYCRARASRPARTATCWRELRRLADPTAPSHNGREGDLPRPKRPASRGACSAQCPAHQQSAAGCPHDVNDLLDDHPLCAAESDVLLKRNLKPIGQVRHLAAVWALAFGSCLGAANAWPWTSRPPRRLDQFGQRWPLDDPRGHCRPSTLQDLARRSPRAHGCANANSR